MTERAPRPDEREPPDEERSALEELRSLPAGCLAPFLVLPVMLVLGLIALGLMALSSVDPGLPVALFTVVALVVLVVLLTNQKSPD